LRGVGTIEAKLHWNEHQPFVLLLGANDLEAKTLIDRNGEEAGIDGEEAEGIGRSRCGHCRGPKEATDTPAMKLGGHEELRDVIAVAHGDEASKGIALFCDVKPAIAGSNVLAHSLRTCGVEEARCLWTFRRRQEEVAEPMHECTDWLSIFRGC